MSSPDLTDQEARLLQAVHAQGPADLYELARAVGVGPRTVQETTRRLAEKNLVYVSGRHVRCTPTGNDVARAQQE